MAEKKYIECEALIDTMQAALDALPKGVFNPNKIGFAAAIEGVKNFPAADVRPVVTCGECIYFRLNSCVRWADGTFMERTDFCSHAAKREES